MKKKTKKEIKTENNHYYQFKIGNIAEIRIRQSACLHIAKYANMVEVYPENGYKNTRPSGISGLNFDLKDGSRIVIENKDGGRKFKQIQKEKLKRFKK